MLTLAVASMIMPARHAQANPRIASTTSKVTVAVTAPAGHAGHAALTGATAATHGATAAKHVVQPGDTLAGIAAALGVPGGWPALYAANRQAIGPDPNLIRPGTVLALPGLPGHPARYRIRAGDTLAGIAAALGVPGGWPALYAANRQAIGPDPNVIHPGAVLAAPRPGPARATPPPARATAPGPVRRHPRPAPRTTPASSSPGPQAEPATTPAAGMPRWLAAMLLAAGLLIAAAFIAEPVMAIGRRASQRRRPRAGPELDAQRIAAANARIVLAGNDKLIVTYSRADDTVYVLTPPGEDPRAVLRAARLVLPDDNYEELAGHLGVPPNWPLE
jgi:LysM repeat protein